MGYKFGFPKYTICKTNAGKFTVSKKGKVIATFDDKNEAMDWVGQAVENDNWNASNRD